MKPLTIDIEDVAQRLDRLEGQNRRLKRVASLLVVGVAALLLMGQAVSKNQVVEAEKFILKDASGKRRAELGVRDGFAGLYVYDESGLVRARLHVAADDWSGLNIYSKDGKDYATMFATGEDVSLFLSRAQGFGAGISVDRNESSLILVEEKKGSAKLRAGDGSPGLAIFGESGKRLAMLGARSDGSSALALFGKEEKNLATLGTLNDGSTGLILSDKEGNPRALLHNPADGSSTLVLYDKRGQPRSTLSGESSDLTPVGQLWVLWSQWLGGNSEPRSLALGAWATRRECEEQKIPYEKRRQEQKETASSGFLPFVCLPDTVAPHGQR